MLELDEPFMDQKKDPLSPGDRGLYRTVLEESPSSLLLHVIIQEVDMPGRDVGPHHGRLTAGDMCCITVWSIVIQMRGYSSTRGFR